MLTVITPASDYNLLTAAELRMAAGLAADDASMDATLTPLGLRVSAAIAAECGVVVSGAAVPTLRQEVLQETFRRTCSRYGLTLSRRPVVSVQSVVEAGATLVSGDYENIDGRLVRVAGEAEIAWQAGKIVVSYTAGWTTVPDDLKMAAASLTKAWFYQEGRDPLLRSRDVPDVYRETYATPDQSNLIGAVPRDIAAMLSRFRAPRFV